MSYGTYAVIERSTGRMVFGQAYTNARAAKLALKNRLCSALWPDYVVASVTITPTVVATVDASGKWTEVSADVSAS